MCHSFPALAQARLRLEAITSHENDAAPRRFIPEHSKVVQSKVAKFKGSKVYETASMYLTLFFKIQAKHLKHLHERHPTQRGRAAPAGESILGGKIFHTPTEEHVTFQVTGRSV